MQNKKTTDPKYAGCWYCDNMIDHPEQIGLLHLGFPRCFVVIPSKSEFFWSDYDQFRNQICKINWLDPNDKGTEQEQDEVLSLLWNFSVEQEKLEEEMAQEYNDDDNY
ncbi:MAG: hypothetical protein RR346_09010 [Bacteroidales bacterium]